NPFDSLGCADASAVQPRFARIGKGIVQVHHIAVDPRGQIMQVWEVARKEDSRRGHRQESAGLKLKSSGSAARSPRWDSISERSFWIVSPLVSTPFLVVDMRPVSSDTTTTNTLLLSLTPSAAR